MKMKLIALAFAIFGFMGMHAVQADVPAQCVDKSGKVTPSLVMYGSDIKTCAYCAGTLGWATGDVVTCSETIKEACNNYGANVNFTHNGFCDYCENGTTFKDGKCQ